MNIFYPQSSFNYNGNEIICKGNLKVFNKDFATDFNTLLKNENQKEIYLPLDFDTEFQIFNKYYEKLFSENNINTLTLTGQLKPVNENWENTTIFNDSLFVQLFPHLERHTVFKDNIFQTFLISKGVNGEIERARNMGKKRYDKISKRKKLVIVLYFHFGLADFYKGFKGDFLKDVLQDSSGKDPKLLKDKRFRTKNDFNYKPKWFFQHLETRETIPIEFQLIDQIAVYGDASRSLEKMFKALNIDTENKELLTKKQKENIINTYQYCEKEFNIYAKNDCRIHECLIEVVKLQFKLFLDLKLEAEILPSLTLGATTKDTFVERLKTFFNDEEIMDRVKQNSSKQLSKNLSKTLAINAICNGGRAFNNNPLKLSSEGFILDWDVMSAYVINMLIQPFFVGKAEYYDSSKERKITLKYFLEKHGHNFTDRTFQIIVTGKLTQNQDYFISNELPNKWYELIDYSNIKDEGVLTELKGEKIPNKEYTEQELKQLKINKEQYEKRGEWCQDKSVSRKIFSKELLNSIITYDGLMWINDHATPKLKEEILNCEVITAMWYEKSKEVFNYDELNGENWTRTTVGELLINEVFINRKKYDKNNPNEKPMNNIFKYMGNSLAGDYMSNLFDISNPIVGNSVCGRTRHSVWLVQAIGTQKIITDGGFLDLLKVTYPHHKPHKINSEIICYQENLKNRNYKQKPLGNIKDIKWLETGIVITFENGNTRKIETWKETLKYFDTLLHEELCKIFPYDHLLNENIVLPHNNQVIKGFAIESKGIVSKAVSHGQANYYFSGKGHHDNFHNGSELKMRSYCLKFRQVRDVLEDFLNGIDNNRNYVKRAKPFLITQIISPKIYSVRKTFFEDKNLIIGDTLYKPCWFRECSLSAFHVTNLEQYQEYTKKQQSLKNKYGQSFEMYFTNEDNTLNYDEMMEYLYELIKNNKKFIKPKNKNNLHHPYYEEYLRLKYWCDYQYSSKNQTIFLEDLIKEFDFEIIDCNDLEVIKTDKDLKNDIDLDDLIDNILVA